MRLNHISNLQDKPWVNYGFTGLCGLLFLICLIKYGTTTSSQALVEMGAKYNYAITFHHEYWRLLVAIFLHAGVEHLIFNLVMLYFLGNELESLLGHWRYAVLFLTAGLGGTLLSFCLNPATISVGASGGIYGLFAAYMVLAYLFPESSYLKQRATTYVVLVILNFLQASMSSEIDNFGHLGGLIFGAIMTYAVGIPRVNRPQKRYRWLALGLTLLLAVICMVIGNMRTLAWVQQHY